MKSQFFLLVKNQFTALFFMFIVLIKLLFEKTKLGNFFSLVFLILSISIDFSPIVYFGLELDFLVTNANCLTYYSIKELLKLLKSYVISLA